MDISVLRETGRVEKFSLAKLEKELKNAGAGATVSKKIALSVREALKCKRQPVPSRMIRKIVISQISRIDQCLLHNYHQFRCIEESMLGMSKIPYNEGKLRALVGKNGKVSVAYGGFIITVLKKESFPWDDIADFLVSKGFTVRLGQDKQGRFQFLTTSF